MERRSFLQFLGLAAATPLIPRLPETPYTKEYVRTTASKPVKQEPPKVEPQPNYDDAGTVSLFDEERLVVVIPISELTITYEAPDMIDVTTWDDADSQFIYGAQRESKIYFTCRTHETFLKLKTHLLNSDKLRLVIVINGDVITIIKTDVVITDIDGSLPENHWEVTLVTISRIFVENA
jgi:hypothetical protein